MLSYYAIKSGFGCNCIARRTLGIIDNFCSLVAAMTIVAATPVAAQSTYAPSSDLIISSSWQLQPTVGAGTIGPSATVVGFVPEDTGESNSPGSREIAINNAESTQSDIDLRTRKANFEAESQGDIPNFHALDDSLHKNHEIPKAVRQREFAYQALNFLDLLQTTYCLERGTCAETNPIYGKNPHRTLLVVSKLASGVLHYAVTKTLLREEPELVDEWQIATIAIQGGVVMWNMRFCF